ncbi:ABC transporter substrate-binding protein [Streptomyces sp. ZYX-F-203]
MPATTTALRRTTALLTVLLMSLAGCGYGSLAPDDTAPGVPPGTPKTDGLDSVRIGYLPNITHATALVGHEQGLFQQELGGTRAVYAVLNAGPSVIEALNSGSLDIAWIGPSPAVNGYLRSEGHALRIVSGSASGGVRFVVRPDAITTAADVAGKRVATPQLGNTQDVAFLTWASEQGWTVDPLTGEGDVTVVRSDNKVIPDAFANGSLDGAWVPEPTASRLVAEGGRTLLDETSLWPDGGFVTTNVIVRQDFLRDHPAAVEAVLRASVTTNAWIDAHPDEAKAAADRQIAHDTGRPLPTHILDPAWESVRVTDDPLATTLATQAEHAAATGLLPRADLRGVYDLTLLNRIRADQGKPTFDDAGLGVS